MTNIAMDIGPRQVLETARLVLQTHLADALSAYAVNDVSLAVPQSYWLYEDIERDWQSPGVGLTITASAPINYSGMGSKDLQHTVVVTTIMRLTDVLDLTADPPVVGDLNYYRQALRDYCDAIGKTLETYMPAAVYQDVSLVYRCDIAQAVGQVVQDQSSTGDYLVASAIELTMWQRVRARTPYTAPVTP
jgi:hypothetical protein